MSEQALGEQHAWKETEMRGLRRSSCQLLSRPAWPPRGQMHLPCLPESLTSASQGPPPAFRNVWALGGNGCIISRDALGLPEDTLRAGRSGPRKAFVQTLVLLVNQGPGQHGFCSWVAASSGSPSPPPSPLPLPTFSLCFWLTLSLSFSQAASFPKSEQRRPRRTEQMERHRTRTVAVGQRPSSSLPGLFFPFGQCCLPPQHLGYMMPPASTVATHSLLCPG